MAQTSQCTLGVGSTASICVNECAIFTKKVPVPERTSQSPDNYEGYVQHTLISSSTTTEGMAMAGLPKNPAQPGWLPLLLTHAVHLLQRG